MMRLHYLQHVPFETPGCILSWAKTNDVAVSSTRLYAGDSLPMPGSYDCLIVMGGPMGVHDVNGYKWLKSEMAFIENAMKAGRGVLGICLGAQLVADVLGAVVRNNRYKEIGWFPLDISAGNDAVRSTGFMTGRPTVFHWHGETFDIPSGAIRVASSDACENQGFVYGDKVVALQFHLEVTRMTVAEMVKNGGHELVPDKYIQNKEDILANTKHIEANNEIMSRILTNLSKES